MSCTNSIHVGDEGTTFEVTVTDCDADGAVVVVPVGTATTIEFRFLLPSGVLKVRTGSVTSPPGGTDGKVEYVAAAGDLSQAGAWKLQVRIGFASGIWRTEEANFTVLAAIEPIFYFDPTPAGATIVAAAVSIS